MPCSSFWRMKRKSHIKGKPLNEKGMIWFFLFLLIPLTRFLSGHARLCPPTFLLEFYSFEVFLLFFFFFFEKTRLTKFISVHNSGAKTKPLSKLHSRTKQKDPKVSEMSSAYQQSYGDGRGRSLLVEWHQKSKKYRSRGYGTTGKLSQRKDGRKNGWNVCVVHQYFCNNLNIFIW